MKILGGEDGRVVCDDSDLADISDNLRLIDINTNNDDIAKLDEEFARMLQVLFFTRIFGLDFVI